MNLTEPTVHIVDDDAVTRALARDARERDAREREARNRQCELRARFGTLPAREFEVLGHVVQGKLNKQIAGDLGIPIAWQLLRAAGMHPVTYVSAEEFLTDTKHP